MNDIQELRKNRESFLEAVGEKHTENVDDILDTDRKRREMILRLETLRRTLKEKSKQIRDEVILEKKENDKRECKRLSNEIRSLEQEIKALEDHMIECGLRLPNPPDHTVPDGSGEEDNPVVHAFSEPTTFHFSPLSHRELGEHLGILDFKRAQQLSGPRFSGLYGAGARLERSLVQWMLDIHTTNGYVELSLPYVVQQDTITGTGQYPVFKEELYRTDKSELFLIPTAEVTLTAYHLGEMLLTEELPKKYTTSSPCFRYEVGAPGKVTGGLIRNHQFTKVELVQIVSEERGRQTLEEMTDQAASLLRMLGLPHRIVECSRGDLGFSAAKTYDVEVWMPSLERYVEISSCSWCTDFQARRLNIREKAVDKKPRYCHTLNASGLAIGRTIAAILENYQESDKSVHIPVCLQSWMGMKRIKSEDNR